MNMCPLYLKGSATLGNYAMGLVPKDISEDQEVKSLLSLLIGYLKPT